MKEIFRTKVPGMVRGFELAAVAVIGLAFFPLVDLLPAWLVVCLGILAFGWLLWPFIQAAVPARADNTALQLSHAVAVALCPDCGGRPKNYREVGMFYRRWLCRCDRCNREWRLNLPAN